jgi:hypothetical protein
MSMCLAMNKDACTETNMQMVCRRLAENRTQDSVSYNLLLRDIYVCNERSCEEHAKLIHV